MTNKEREIILKELYMRVPYRINVLAETWNYEWDQELSLLERVTGIDEYFIYVKVIDEHTGEEYKTDKHCIDMFSIKPFLRPMSSMTEEEKEELYEVSGLICYDGLFTCKKLAKKQSFIADTTDWLNAHHFDYRGLIEKGLALEAPEGMYK